MVEDEIDFEQRELCADGNCTGVIGDDGRCRECGRSRSGEAAASASAEAVLDAVAGGDSGSDEFADRQLCHDGNCTGILGSDGRCKVCGKSS